MLKERNKMNHTHCSSVLATFDRLTLEFSTSYHSDYVFKTSWKPSSTSTWNR